MRKSKTPPSTQIEPALDSDGMFSAASFAGVVGAYVSGKWTEPERLTQSSPPIIAFYGFRGGAGRTTTLAHVAALLASRQVQVVAIDLDLEAPGLHHVLACPTPEEDRGTLALLRAAATATAEDLSKSIRLAPHIVKSGLDLGTPIRVLPAGRLSERYLERLEDLGVPLWHIADGPSPLEAVMQQVKDELRPQVIFLDCRTGLSGLSASALFHVSDVVVCFFPVSEQSLDGLEIFLKAAKAAKLRRGGRPEILIVPSMVPEGPEGRKRLDDWFLPKIEAQYAEIVLGTSMSDDSAESVAEQVPIVREGIEYRRGIALADCLHSDFVQRSGGAYHALMQQLEGFVGVERQAAPVDINASIVLTELIERANLKNLAFAESTASEEIVKKFIKPSDFKALVDRATWYIVGAKGAGKTWLWTYLLSEVNSSLSHEMSYLAAHGPGQELLSASAMRELERDKSVRMVQRQVHGALWLLYAAKRILSKHDQLADRVLAAFQGEEKRLIQRLIKVTATGLQGELATILAYDRAATLAEHLIRALDAELLAQGVGAVTLIYDALDVGFGSDEKSIEMRGRFVSALVEAIEPLRGSCKRLFFKLFLREDIFAELSIQNQSHLAAATVELRWEPRDLWVLALNLVSESSHFLKVLHGIDPTAGPDNWPEEDEQRQLLLAPLWGAQLEAGNKISTSLFVQRRTSDGKGRLFPRTLVQLLAAAVEHQKTLEARPDRVLRSAAIQAGYKQASVKRVEDLRKEYAVLKDYLDGLKGMTPTGTETEIRDYIRRRTKRKSKSKGAEAGALHAGPGGWHKVIERLLEIGVLREYKRARGDGGEQKFEIALLYRPGLGVKAFGV
jgi:MinD-like ATPase involved in chromosome partitioning or flagellar assembly